MLLQLLSALFTLGVVDFASLLQVWGCYCILTRLQFFDLHFQVLWDLLAAERSMRMQASPSCILMFRANEC